MSAGAIGESGRPVLVTGGAGFIGANVADRLAASGVSVLVFDNLSRPSVERNVEWLRERWGERIRFVRADVLDSDALRTAVAACEWVFHFAAQVAVTTSLSAPRFDFEANALGTLKVLEAIRANGGRTPLLFTSTNKVYGALDDLVLREESTRHAPKDAAIAAHGISEARPLDFHSPYGCSKGAADAYVLDYARSFGLRAVVFRMSCIYGPRQFGSEDQGWVAHFLRAAIAGNPITLYGDGKQVRDLLFIDDLVDAMVRCQQRIDELSGQAFNVGGGAPNTMSLVELLEWIRARMGLSPSLLHERQRVGDQRYYVSDTRKLERAIGWRPRVDVAAGLARLAEWLTREGALPSSLGMSTATASASDTGA